MRVKMIEQEIMLTSLLQCQRIDLYVDLKVLSPSQEQQLKSMQERRKQGEPLQYILGECEFMGLRFQVHPSTFIPRPETEILVETAVELAEKIPHRPLRILDLGTGSGNIAISLAKWIERSHIMAVDISQDTLAVALENAKFHRVEHKIQFCHNDMTEHFLWDKNLENFDMIVSNPPYIPTFQLRELPAEVKQEPVLALDGGSEGMDFLKFIIENGIHVLNEKGFMILEIGDGQNRRVAELFQANPGYKDMIIHKDYRRQDRIVVAQKSYGSKTVINTVFNFR